MDRLIKAFSALLQPVDRDYKQHDKKREEHLEVKFEDTSHCLRSGLQTYTLLIYAK